MLELAISVSVNVLYIQDQLLLQSCAVLFGVDCMEELHIVHKQE